MFHPISTITNSAAFKVIWWCFVAIIWLSIFCIAITLFMTAVIFLLSYDLIKYFYRKYKKTQN